ncbi:unnamed protein product [Cunninghamella blakesleeana]
MTSRLFNSAIKASISKNTIRQQTIARSYSTQTVRTNNLAPIIVGGIAIGSAVIYIKNHKHADEKAKELKKTAKENAEQVKEEVEQALTQLERQAKGAAHIGGKGGAADIQTGEVNVDDQIVDTESLAESIRHLPEDMKKEAQERWDRLKKNMNEQASQVQDTVGQTKESILQAAQEAKDKSEQEMDYLSKKRDEQMQSAQDTYYQTKDTVESTIDDIKNKTQDTYQYTKGKVNEAWDQTTDQINDTLHNVKENVTHLSGEAQTKGKEMKEDVENYYSTNINEKVQEGVDQAKEKWEDTKQQVETVQDDFNEDASEKAQENVSFAKEKWDEAKKEVTEVAEHAKEHFNEFSSKANEKLKSPIHLDIYSNTNDLNEDGSNIVAHDTKQLQYEQRYPKHLFTDNSNNKEMHTKWKNVYSDQPIENMLHRQPIYIHKHTDSSKHHWVG